MTLFGRPSKTSCFITNVDCQCHSLHFCGNDCGEGGRVHTLWSSTEALTHWIGDECQGRVGKASHNDFQIAIFLKFDDEPPHQNAHSCVLGGAADGLSVRHIPLFKDTPIRDFWWNLSAARSHGLSIESVVNDLAERAFPGGSEGKVSTRVETIRKLARSGLRV